MGHSNMWWWLREIWHKPSWQSGICLDVAFYRGQNKYINMSPWELDRAWILYRLYPREIWKDIKSLCRWSFWQLMWLQPLRCNCKYGGWRTRFCEWLENKARDSDEKREMKNEQKKKQ